MKWKKSFHGKIFSTIYSLSGLEVMLVHIDIDGGELFMPLSERVQKLWKYRQRKSEHQ